jgi:acyl-CoA synthetase (NDP forming)
MALPTMLSEAASKQLLLPFGVPFAQERVCSTVDQAVEAAGVIGFPVVIKLSGDNIAHKTERGLVRLNVADMDSARRACSDLLTLVTDADGEVSFLVAEMVKGDRELIVGVINDPQFGYMVALGIGGVFAEAIDDVVLRPLPLTVDQAMRMIDDVDHQSILGPFRGTQPINRSQLATVLASMSQVCASHPEIDSLDINPLIARSDGSLVAVDALVGVGRVHDQASQTYASTFVPTSKHFDALFNPRAIVVIGASSHPGKFGFVSLHNALANKFAGGVYATNLQRENILGVQTVSDLSELPVGEIDLAFFCTPASSNEALLKQCAQLGISSAFIASAGYRESGESGEVAEASLLSLANSLGMLIAGPNGQGVVSTPASLCLQIVAPYPPQGGISVASQSGNFVSSFLNYSRQSGVGIARAISAGNATQISVENFLDYFASDAETKVALTYIENVGDGESLLKSMKNITAVKPLVVLKGGATAAGSKAAQSHTGAMASNDRVFLGATRSSGAIKVSSVEEAFDTAATFATQPLPRGKRVAVLTTVGGWGVVTADAIARDGVLDLVDLSDDLMSKLSTLLPPRWSRNNPIDCAGGETRDTVTEIMDIVAAHDSIDAVIFLGIGIQSNQAKMMRSGGFYPDHGLERIVSYHEKQDERYAITAREVASKYGKPILIATELAVADPANAGPAAVRESGAYCYPTGARAATSLAHLYEYAKYRGIAQ